MKRPPTLSPKATPIAREIHRRMIDANLGQKELAVKAGLNDTYARDLFKAKSGNPKSEQLQKLAAVLGCTVEELLKPGVSDLDSDLRDFVDPANVLPLLPDEISIVRMWRVLDKPGRDLVLLQLTDLLTRQLPKGRKVNDV